MARQGNFVTVPGGGVNFTKDISSSLADLSKSLLGQASDEEKRARLDADRQYQIGRDVLSDQRFDKEQGILDADRQRQTDIRDFYKNFQVDRSGLKTAKGKSVFGLTDEELSGELGQQARDIIRLTQEDVRGGASNRFRTQFGEQANLDTLAPAFAGFDSIAALQTTEDERAKALQTQFNKAADFDLELTKAMKPTSAESKSFSKKGGASVPKSWGDINPRDFAKEFEGTSWLGLTMFGRDSQKEDVVDLVNHLKETYRGMGLSVQQGKAAINEAMGSFTEGTSLDHIDDSDIAKIEQAGLKGAASYDANPGQGYLRYSSDMDKFRAEVRGQVGGLKTVSPTNIRASRRAETQARLDELFGRGAAPAPTTARTPTRSTPAPRPGGAGTGSGRLPVNPGTNTPVNPPQGSAEEELVTVSKSTLDGNLTPKQQKDLEASKARFAKEQAELLGVEGPDTVALETPLTWSAIGTKKGTKLSPEANFNRFIKDAKGTDLTDPNQVQQMINSYSGNLPMSEAAMVKRIVDAKEGNLLSQMMPNAEAYSGAADPGITQVAPELAFLPALRPLASLTGAVARPLLSTVARPAVGLSRALARPVTGPARAVGSRILQSPAGSRVQDATNRLLDRLATRGGVRAPRSPRAPSTPSRPVQGPPTASQAREARFRALERPTVNRADPEALRLERYLRQFANPGAEAARRSQLLLP